MLSSTDPYEFWKSIGQITGWRLMTHDGFDQGVFTTSDMRTVMVGPEVANLLDTLVTTLGDLSFSSLALVECVQAATCGTGRGKKEAKAVLSKNIVRHLHELKSFQKDLPNLFAHYAATELDHSCSFAGSA